MSQHMYLKAEIEIVYSKRKKKFFLRVRLNSEWVTIVPIKKKVAKELARIWKMDIDYDYCL